MIALGLRFTEPFLFYHLFIKRFIESNELFEKHSSKKYYFGSNLNFVSSKNTSDKNKRIQRWFKILSGPLLFLVLFNSLSNVMESPHAAVISVSGWMVVWWFLEVVHLGVTALLPLILWPVLGIQSMAETSIHYSHPLVFLFFGGFVLALAIQRWGLHKRIALWILTKSGPKPHQILFGFMMSTYLLSMWISNTATTVMMLPIALSVIEVISGELKKSFTVSLLLGIAWSANVGGISTLVGTPPNLVFAGFVSDQLQTEISFSEWLIIGLPISLLLFFSCYFILRVVIKMSKLPKKVNTSSIQKEYDNLGKMGVNEKRVLLIFVLTALVWIFRSILVNQLGISGLTDTSVAIISAVLLFALPRKGGKKGLLAWSDTKELPWGILLLFGGGLALASGFKSSGLLDAIGNLPLQSLGVFGVLLMIIIISVFLTELVSNLALVTTVLPIVYGIAMALGVEFYALAIPFTIGASCAFMLPMATPPNAIIFSSGVIKIKTMARLGIWANAASILILTIVAYMIMI